MIIDLLNYLSSKLEYFGIKKVRKVRGSDGGVYIYTLRDFDRKECIFVHIPKAAGVSVNKALFGHHGGGHKTACEYENIFGNDFYRYYKFTFTRNPYTRLVSAYDYLRKGGHPAWPDNNRFRKEVISHYDGFSDFVLKGLRPYEEDWEHPHFYPQTFFIEIEDDIVVDFIGSVESFKEDFRVVSGKIGYNGSVPVLNETKGERKEVSEYYKKDSVIRRVQEVYSRDFEKLGYSTNIEKVEDPPSISQYKSR